MMNPNPRNLGAPKGPGFLVIKSSNGKYLSTSPLNLVLGLKFIRVLFLLHSILFFLFYLNPLNAELNPICHLLALLGAHAILHISRIRIKLLLFIFLLVLCVLSTFLFFKLK
jgi:hypothetical protein